MRIRSAGLLALLLSMLIATAAPVAQGATCEGLLTLKLKDTAITAAQPIRSGKFETPYGNVLDHLPAFCRVAGILTPTSDSTIRFEVWLPESGWNERLLGVGNGGFAGSIGYSQMAGNLKRGYATGGTDAGHQGEAQDASWAFGHPEKVIDFGYRAIHEETSTAKAVIQAFYGHPQQRAYFDSCSDGGREALMEAQRFPEDYDGILAGAPANFWTHLLGGNLDLYKTSLTNPAAYISARKTPAITNAALAACDAQDGVKDGLINNPPACHFDPSVLLCHGEDSLSCLTAPQVASLKKLYSGAVNSQGKSIFPGFAPGDENPAWGSWILGQGPGGGDGGVYLQNYFRYMVLQDPLWNPVTADVDASLRAADEKTADALNATASDLSAFHARGGKLILYHGWNDPAIPPRNSIDYYESVLKTMGSETAATFTRLYMVPGMEHCAGGPGPSSFGQLGITTSKGPEYGIYTALEQWVEKGTVPAAIVATKYAGAGESKSVKMTRPLCAYPQIAKYKGSGDTNDSANFVCSAATP